MFTGTSIKLILDDSIGVNIYSVFLDEDYERPILIWCQKGESTYSVADGLKDTTHTIMVFRRLEDDYGATRFKGFVLETGKTLVDPPPRPDRKIEFYGNSITVGMGIDAMDIEPDNKRIHYNNFLAFGAQTARNLNAEYVCIAKSGIGIMASFFDLIMPEYYNRLDPLNPDSQWDFSQWTPDVVVINLMQNDNSRIHILKPVPKDEEIVEAYFSFVKNIRDNYPGAHIFCVLGTMNAILVGKPWFGFIEKAVEKFHFDLEDENVYAYKFSYQGFNKHPRVRHQTKMASELTAFIQEKINW
jgi:hypothetical protein